MSSLPPGQATTLKAAFRVCDIGPLSNAEEIQRYYVNLSQVRNTEAIESVSTRLQFLEPGEFSSILFTGHRGCGKSTELFRIRKTWESEYRVIYLEADSELDVLDAEYTDLYLVIIKKIADELTQLKLTFNAELLASFESWFQEITQETQESIERSTSIDAGAEGGLEIPLISKLVAKLQAQIKGATQQKKTIRQVLQKDIARLRTDINLLLKDAFKKLTQKYPEYPKGFLIIFDNLDRVPPNVTRHLFFDYAPRLQELCCTIIYTAPIDVAYSEAPLRDDFSIPHIMPMVSIYKLDRTCPDLDYNEAALTGLVDLIEQRVNLEVIFESREQVLKLAKASGGHVRQLMQMTATACLTAATRGHQQVTLEDVDYAIKQVQFSFDRWIPKNYYSALAEVCLTKDIRKDEIGRSLLFNLAVLEYNGNDRWTYINPVIQKISGFQQALNAATGAAGMG